MDNNFVTLKHSNKSKLIFALSCFSLPSLIYSTNCIVVYVNEISITPIVPTWNTSWLWEKFAIIIFGEKQYSTQTWKMFFTTLNIFRQINFSQSTLSYLWFRIISKYLIETLAFAISFSLCCLINYVGINNVNVILDFWSIKSTRSIDFV